MSVSDYYQHTINKPEKIIYQNQYSDIIVIDSQDRNKFLYKNSNNFSIEIENTLYDVIEVELMSLYYNYIRYMYDKTNNKIYFKKGEGNYEYSIEIPSGNYETNDLITIFNTTYLETKNFHQTIQNDDNITLNYKNSINRYYFRLPNIIYTLDFKGSEHPYQTTLYGDTINNTNIYSYKSNTDGRFIGFSANEFTNKIVLNTITISYISQENAKYKYNMRLYFQTSKETNNTYDILNLKDTNLNINFIDEQNNIHTINYQDIICYRKIGEEQIQLYIFRDSSIFGESNAHSITINNSTFYSNILLSDIQSTSIRDNYLLLDITEFNRLNSNNKIINNSFVDIPVINKTLFENTKNHGTIKYFNPPIKKLDRLSITIKDYYGNILDDDNNFTLIFAIKCLNNKDNIMSK